MTHSQIEQQDIIDRYLVRKLSPDVEAEFEDHYVACPECVDKLQLERQAIAIISETFAEGGTEPAGRRFFFPLSAWGLAAALSAVAVYVTAARRAPTPQVESPRSALSLPVVELESYRAGATQIPKMTPELAKSAFLLRLDLRGVSTHEAYSLTIVNDSGEHVWSGAATVPSGSDWLQVRIEGARLDAGAFWVRVSGLRAGAKAEFLREYSLIIGP